MTSEGLLDLHEVSVTYARWGQAVVALDRLSLSIPPNEWVLIAGPNGSGKSTLLGVMAGSIRVSAGSVHLGSGTGPGRNGTRVFCVHQNPLQGTAAGLTIEENLRVAEAPGAPSRARFRRERYVDWLRPIGLDNRLRQPVESLSGGERQLLALLIARVRQSSLILLDEPFSAMDPARAAIAHEQIAALHGSGRTIVQVTHDIAKINDFRGRVIGLQSGRLVYDSSQDQQTARSLDWLWNASETHSSSH